MLQKELKVRFLAKQANFLPVLVLVLLLLKVLLGSLLGGRRNV